jgi:hypothetical protein
MSSPSGDTCSVEDCDRPAKRAGLCEGHRKRKRLGQPVSGQLRIYGNTARTFAEAMFAFADAADGDEEAYYRAWKRVCTAGRRHFGTK